MEQSASQFLALADELLIEIISNIKDRQSICSLARVSHRLQGLAEPYIYNSIFIRTGDQARNLVKLFNSRQARMRSVHDLQIRYLQSDEEGIEELEGFFEHFPQIRQLRIETPCCNDSPWQAYPNKPALPWKNEGRIDIACILDRAVVAHYKLKLEQPMLGRLQSLTLHSHNNGDKSERYELGEVANIFLLPNLRFMFLSCFDIGMSKNVETVISRYVDASATWSSTLLETLVFEECNISYHALEVLLRLPKALKNLTLGERMHHTSDIDPLGFRPNLLDAFLPQRTSLKYFKHVGGGKYITQAYLLPFLREDISMLQALETLELGQALENKYISQGLPPTLQKIRFLDVFYRKLDSKSSLFDNPMWSSSFQNSGLRHQIDVVLYRLHPLQHLSVNLWSFEERREEIDRLATKLRKQNTDFAIYTLKPCERGFIPPYMYGEELPEEVLTYVSSSPNVFAGKYYELGIDLMNTEPETSSTFVEDGHSEEEDGE